jgi:hypothetical protein
VDEFIAEDGCNGCSSLSSRYQGDTSTRVVDSVLVSIVKEQKYGEIPGKKYTPSGGAAT